MEITRSRELTIRMGDYETFKTSATVRVSQGDLGIPLDKALTVEQLEKVPASLIELANDQLDAAMADDIADAQHLSGERKSFIHRIPTNEKD